MVNSNHSPTPLYSSDWGICFDMPHAYLLIKSKKNIYFVYLSLPLFTFSIIVYQILNFYFSLKWTFPLNMDFVRNFLFIIVFLTFVFVYLTKWILNLNIEFRISSFLWSGLCSAKKWNNRGKSPFFLIENKPNLKLIPTKIYLSLWQEES